MAIREDLVSSAVTFLQDPSVANAPLDKRIAFLQSKNLTQQEIDASLARADEGGSAQAGYTYNQPQPQQSPSRAPPPPPPPSQYGYGYGPPQYQPGYWQQPPPEVPRRDWRDYFIMATVMSGLSYGVYFIAKRYIVPLIAPPTPPQLEQDKAAVNESFERAFALIEQLSADTAAIKDSESARKEKLDSALTDVEVAVEEMKRAARRRDDDSRRLNDEVRALQAKIPQAMENQQKITDDRLKELNTELKSLKTLISNRMSGAGVAGAAVQRPGSANNAPGATATTAATGTTGNTAVGRSTPDDLNGTATPEAATPPVAVPDRSNTASPYGRFGSKGGIPAWQLAASGKKADEKKDTTESGTVSDADGTAAPASPPPA